MSADKKKTDLMTRIAKAMELLPEHKRECWLKYAEGVADMQEEVERLKRELAARSA